MEPWYKVVTPRKEVREGRSFDPSEFAIALEQVVAGTAPPDYRDPELFLSRTSFTKALREHTGLVLRRLSGETTSSAPVMTLVTQFGGGKTHTLTLLFHLAKSHRKLASNPDVEWLLSEAGVRALPKTKAAVFVGNAWDPADGRETPWIDVARQLAGDEGVKLLGRDARTSPPGTEAIARLIEAAGGSALLLFDEVLNCLNRHRALADPFHAFIQNLTVAVTGAAKSAAVISLPRSEVEMTPWDQDWQQKITRVVRRVAKDLIVNDEAEISEVIRKRLFEDLGKESARRAVARTYAAWCFERRSQLPPEWAAVDSAATDVRAREHLRSRFEVCYPFHPATLTVFQRKWSSLPQFQQTRGTLAMLAQWVSLAFRDGYQRARREPLVTLGSAPLDDRAFRSAVLGQLGESRLLAAIESDIVGPTCHAAALDADTSGPLRDIHRRVAAAVLFESSGGQSEKAAHLPDLRFALGEPGIDTTSIDTAVGALARKGYYIRKVGSDGYRFGFNPTLNKVVSDRRSSLDDEEIAKVCATIVKREFERGAQLPVVAFPVDGSAVPDATRLTVVVLAPTEELDDKGRLRAQVGDWSTSRGTVPRLYPGALLWAARKPGKELRDRVATWLAWKRVSEELQTGSLPHDFDKAERAEVASQVRDAEDAAIDEVWAEYRYVLVADRREADGLRVIDLGAGHATASETLTGRLVAALRMESLLNDSIGAGYLERHWPPAFAETGAWPLSSLRQAFLSGALTRVLDIDGVLVAKLPEFVAKGEFGLASGQQPDGSFGRVWFEEPVDRADITFEHDVFLLKKAKARALKAPLPEPKPRRAEPAPSGEELVGPPRDAVPPRGGNDVETAPTTVTFVLEGELPLESWNRVGTKLVPRLRGGSAVKAQVRLETTVAGERADGLLAELKQAVSELDLAERIKIDRNE